jgi:hypothetical protein
MSKAKKSLLEEGTVRQFMKLANIQPLASNFINETYGGMDEDEEEFGEMPPADIPSPEEAETEIEMEPEAPVGEPSQSDMAAAIESALETFLQAGAEKVAAEFEGVEVAVEAEPSAEAGLEAEPSDIEAADVGSEEASFEPVLPGAEGAEGDDGDEGDEDIEDLEEVSVVDEDSIMQETYRRVVKRLGDMNREHKLVESVTNKVFARLQKK